MVKIIKTTARFEKRYKKLSRKIKEKAKEKEYLFRVTPFGSLLRIHKLHGKDKNAWAFWINYKYRVKFIFFNEEEVLFLDVGTHDVY